MHQPPPLSSDCRRALLSLARSAILEAIVQGRVPDSGTIQGSPVEAVLAQPGAAFVTLYARGRLRGCVGRSEADLPLAETVLQSALAAALQDPRFAPLEKSETADLKIEISVLSDLWPVSLQEIEIGKHGLLVRCGYLRGLLLPQVAGERGWSAQRFLEETCRKAGLGSQAWREPETQVFAFTVEVFSEADFPAGYSSSA